MSGKEMFRIRVPGGEALARALDDGINDVFSALVAQKRGAPSGDPDMGLLNEFPNLKPFPMMALERSDEDGSTVLRSRSGIEGGGVIIALALQKALRAVNADELVTYTCVDVENASSRIFGVSRDGLTVIDSDAIAHSIRQNFETLREQAQSPEP